MDCLPSSVLANKAGNADPKRNYTGDGRLLYAGRAGTGMMNKELRLAGVLAPLQIPKMPLAAPRRDSRFGSPLKLSRVPRTPDTITSRSL
jgi:hypothetical protein